MRRIILLVLFSFYFGITAQAQVINFGKTLPVSAFSLTLAPVYHIPSIYHPNINGLSYMVMAGYGIGYDIDVSLKYGNTYSLTKEDGLVNGPDYFGLDFQYLFRETRKNYYSLFGGVHKWEEYGLDLTFSFTYTPQYLINLTAGLDLDLDFTNVREMVNPSIPELRAWIPVNIGFNFDDRYFIFLEYDLPATERSWDIIGGGITFIFR